MKSVEAAYKKDKDFYEEALEARMNQLEEYEEKVERMEGELAEERRENERLKLTQGAAGDVNNPNANPADAYLQEELQEVKLGLKQANNEKNDMAQQLQDLKIELQGVRRELAIANN